MNVIQFQNVWEMYNIPFLNGKQTVWENFWALKDIKFDIAKGQTAGIVGRNGSGKSTILKLIAGILSSDRGQVIVKGKVSGLLELGAGFQPELTGKENIYLNVGLFGLTPVQIDNIYDSIVDFAEIGKFMNAPVKCYSSGMFMRLAFAIAIQVDPDIFLVDDTLAVGDEDAQRKCVKKIFELKERGKTIVLVTHDMCLASLLCDNLIFLNEGRIVSQGPAREIIGQYMEVVGDKKGIGVMQSGLLRATFNNGKIILSWDNTPITKGTGVHSSVVILNKLYDSTQAEWDVEIKEGQLEIIATGKWWRLPMSQIWTIKINSDGSILWNMETILEEDIHIEKIQANIMLAENYNEWFTTKANGHFYNILPKDKNWEELFRCSPMKTCMGVKGVAVDGKMLPPVLYETLSQDSADIAVILNSDYGNNARILQFSKFQHNVLLKGKSIFFTGKISFNTATFDQYADNKKDISCLGNGKLRLIFEENSTKILWNNVILTKGLGIYSSLLCDNIWHFSTHADWTIEIDNNILRARARWDRIPVVQTWEFNIIGDTSIYWNVKTEVLQELNIDIPMVNITLTDAYENWITSESCGRFAENFSEFWFDILQGNIKNGLVGVEDFKDDESALPRIIVMDQDGDKNTNNLAKIFNSDFEQMSRIIQLQGSVDTKRLESPHNKYYYVSGKILICQAKGKVSDYVNISLIDRYPVRLLFKKGSGHLFWKGIEITKNLCLYTSIRSLHTWNDSTQADWKCKSISDDKLILEGRWKNIPILQIWQFQLMDNNLIKWQIGMRVLEQIVVDRQQTNIMLSDNYDNWMVTDASKGRFTSFKSDIDSDWDRIWSGQAKRGIGVSCLNKNKQYMPKVIFAGKLDEHSMHIVNSDAYYRGRVLQSLNQNKEILLPGEYNYFSGSIMLCESE
jgi:ABC-type polysaccharide/polyol phosphate transport system ATPase subunit